MTRPLITLDFETYYESRNYTLKKLTYLEYIRHDLFKIHGVGVLDQDGTYTWYDHYRLDDFQAYLDEIGEDVEMLCHNTMFDGMILHLIFNYHPAVYRDTQGMSRGMFIGQRAGLKQLAERLFPNDKTMRKGNELVTTIDKFDLTPEESEVLGGYCRQDCHLTRACYDVMEPHFPDRELALIDLTLQMYCDPILEVDVPLTQKTLTDRSAERNALIKASGLSATVLGSNLQFKAWIEEQGIKAPMKTSLKTGEETFAGGKSDLEFQITRKANPKLEHVWAGRIAAKSTGEISRAERFLQVAELAHGKMPVALSYYGAHTGRYGGCLTADTEVMVYSEYAHCGYKIIPITQVSIDDLIWDGDAFVAHEGVVFSGMKEVITHDGVTGTKDHIVFTRDGKEKSLAQANTDGDSLKVPPSPDEHDVVLARAFGQDHHQIYGDPQVPQVWHKKASQS